MDQETTIYPIAENLKDLNLKFILLSINTNSEVANLIDEIRTLIYEAIKLMDYHKSITNYPTDNRRSLKELLNNAITLIDNDSLKDVDSINECTENLKDIYTSLFGK